MNILLVAYACEPDRGSEPGAGWNWSLNLSKTGHNVTVLTNSRGKSSIEAYLSVNPTENLHIVYIDVPKWTSRFFIGRIGMYAKYYVWQQLAFRYAKVNKSRFDLTHHISWSGLSVGSIFWKLGLPFVFGPSGGGQVAPRDFSGFFGADWKREKYRSFVVEHLHLLPFIRRFIKNTDLYLATNKDTYERVQQCGACNVQSFFDIGLQTNYFPESFPTRESSNALRVLWVARLYSNKGLLLALDALELCDFPIILSIYGDGPLGQYVQKWVTDRNLTEKVEWVGQKPWLELRKAYQSHDVFLFTSLRESTGVQLLEAMANGLPIITLDHMGAKEFVPESAGIKIPVTSPEEVTAKIAESLDWLYFHPQERITLGKAAYEYSKLFNWECLAQKMNMLYETLIQGK